MRRFLLASSRKPSTAPLVPVVLMVVLATLASCSLFAPPASSPPGPVPSGPELSEVRLIPAEKHVGTGNTPHGISYASGRVFVCNLRSNTVAVVNAITGEREPDLPVESHPGYSIASADERLVGVTNEGSASVTLIDATVPRVLHHVRDVGTTPDKLKFTPDGKLLYVALGGEPAVARIDVAADPPTSRKLPAGPADGLREIQIAESLALVPDTGGESLTLIDLASDTTRQIPTGPRPKATAVATYTLDGQVHRVLVVGSRGDGKARLYALPAASLVDTLEVGPKPFEAVAVGRFVFMTLSEAHSVAVIDAAARKVVARIAVGRKPSHIFAAPPGPSGPRTQLWVGCDDSPYVSVIDADRQVLYANAEAQGGHHTVAFSSDGTRAFLSNLASSSLSIIDRTKL